MIEFEPKPIRAPRTILFVDDLPMFRELGSVFLSRTGRVLVAADGVEALAVAEKCRPDLILTDLHMPRMGGDALIRRLKRDPHFATTPVIAMIGHHDSDEHARAALAGADDVLTKPLSRLALLEAVNRHLRYRDGSGRPRVSVEMAVECRLGKRCHSSVARNLSRGGLYLEMPQQLNENAEVALSFVLPDTKEALESTARRVWANPDASDVERKRFGYGMRFVQLEADVIEALDNFIFERVGSAADPHSSGGLTA